MTVKTVKEAWNQANKLFPTDYVKDDRASTNAGYPIYMSMAEGNNSWISDLGVTLELNIQKGKGIETIRINIVQEPKIKEEVKWDSDDVRTVCIDNDLYTCGTIREYDKMLNMVDNQEPTTNAIYMVAKDILEHSNDQTIENIMFLLSNKAVRRFYTVDDGMVERW